MSVLGSAVGRERRSVPPTGAERFTAKATMAGWKEDEGVPDCERDGEMELDGACVGERERDCEGEGDGDTEGDAPVPPARYATLYVAGSRYTERTRLVDTSAT